MGVTFQLTSSGRTYQLLLKPLKTQPSEQWAIARKFSFQLKQAIDASGITLGVPQQEIWHHYENGNKLTGEMSEET